jgi:3-oxoacyl-[acyl-carrier protein] reductase
MNQTLKQTFANYPDLKDKVVLVTGSSRGLGAETCRRFAENGASVVVNGRDAKTVDKTVADIHVKGGKAMGVVADCTQPADLETMREHIEEAFGPVDVLAMFAASGDSRPGPVETITEEAWHSSIDGSLASTFFTLKTFLPGMMARKSGTILTMASATARSPHSQAPLAYSAAKAGVVMLTRNVAMQVAPYGVRVNCLAPSAILNDLMRETMSEEQQQQLAASFPLGRIGHGNDVAQAALFLASTASSWITGVTLDIAGGKVMA